jgi:hypothetical protein
MITFQHRKEPYETASKVPFYSVKIDSTVKVSFVMNRDSLIKANISSFTYTSNILAPDGTSEDSISVSGLNPADTASETVPSTFVVVFEKPNK